MDVIDLRGSRVDVLYALNTSIEVSCQILAGIMMQKHSSMAAIGSPLGLPDCS